jgi:AraC family transcriptional activator of mtrCDE
VPSAGGSADFLAVARCSFVSNRGHARSDSAGLTGSFCLLSGPSRCQKRELAEPARGWTLDELADLANTSRATLVRLFQKSVQASPLAFLADRRLTLARQRMRTTAMPDTAVAGAVGYRPESAFNRAYRRRVNGIPFLTRRTCSDADRPNSTMYSLLSTPG